MEFRVRVKLVDTKDGGRKNPIGSGYRATIFLDCNQTEANDGILTLEDTERCYPGNECLARIRPLVPELLRNRIKAHTTFDLREGRRKVGSGTVVELL